MILRIFHALVPVIAWFGAVQAFAQLPLTDRSDGMTCHYYSAAAKLSWKQNGGDWVDREGAEHGLKAFDVRSVQRLDAPQVIRWDAKVLVEKWLGGEGVAGAVFIRPVEGPLSGVVDFVSRESSNSSMHPSLLIEWVDGKSTRIPVQADTNLACPTYRSTGSAEVLNVGGRRSGILVFPFKPEHGKQVQSAVLELTAVKQYGNGAQIGLFNADLPWAQEAEVTRGIASTFTLDRGISKHHEVLYATGFESESWRSSWADLRPSSTFDLVKEDVESGFEPLDGKALRIKILKGHNTGISTHYRFAGALGGEPDEAYFRYYLRLGNDWNPVADGGKLPGFAGTYGRAGWGMRSSDGYNGWSARGAFFKQMPGESAASGLRGIGSYVYQVKESGGSGEQIGWDQGVSGLIRKNQWYSVEQYVRMNTPGQSDGVLRAWIDGQLALERLDMRYRDIEDLHIESVWMDVYHGGTAPAPDTMTLYIDNLVISRGYVGPIDVLSKR